jgi:hypothetical protein
MASVSNLVSPWSPVVQEIRRIRTLPVLPRASRALALIKAYSPELLAEAARHANVYYWDAIVAKARQIEVGPPPEEILLEAAEALRGEHWNAKELASLSRSELLLTVRAMYRKHRLLDPSGEGDGVWLSFVDRVHRAHDPDWRCHCSGSEFFWYTRDPESIRVGTFLNTLFNDAQTLSDYEGIRRGSPEWLKIVEGDLEVLKAHEAEKAATLAAAPEIATRTVAELAKWVSTGHFGCAECVALALSAVDPMVRATIYERAADLKRQEKDDDPDYYEQLERRYGSC